MERSVEPEILDTLAHDDPEALRNRRDLWRLNFVMGNHRWIESMLLRHARPGERALEIGAGMGELATRLRKRLGRRAGIRVDGLDLWPEPRGWPKEARWWRQDVREFDRFGDYPLVVVNLLLHQFDDDALQALGEQLGSSARVIIASEPARRSWHLAQLSLLGWFGLGRVTLHDGAVSIRAGFVDDELPRYLGLDGAEWTWRCSSGWRGQYRMVAVRREV